MYSDQKTADNTEAFTESQNISEETKDIPKAPNGDTKAKPKIRHHIEYYKYFPKEEIEYIELHVKPLFNKLKDELLINYQAANFNEIKNNIRLFLTW